MAEQFGWQGTDLGTYIQNPVRGGFNLPDLSGLKISTSGGRSFTRNRLKHREDLAIQKAKEALVIPFKTDGRNYPKLRKGESTKSFLKRVSDWERVSNQTYPNRSYLNRVKSTNKYAKKDYSGSNWQDEVKEYSASKPRLTDDELQDLRKQEFLENPVAYEGTPIPTNQAELDKAKSIAEFRNQNQSQTPNKTKEVNQPTTRQKVVNVLDKTAKGIKAVNAIIPGNEIHGSQYTPDPADFRRATGQAFNDKRWQSLLNSNQVFDTTKKFGDAGGYWINDNRGIPRFVKYKGG